MIRATPWANSLTWKRAAISNSRLQNPTVDAVAAKICELEGGTAAMLTSSGMAANFLAVFNICSCGDHIVSSSAVYGGTYNLFAVTMEAHGDIRHVCPAGLFAGNARRRISAANKGCLWRNDCQPRAPCPGYRKNSPPLRMRTAYPLSWDNTFPTPVNCQPFAWGADIVTHSTTKYMDGHGSAVGGAIVDSGHFDWTQHAEKYPGLCTPDESYHGVVYTERFGLEGAYITKATGAAHARFGRDPLAHERLFPQPWPGKPARAHAAPLRKRPGRRALSAGA